MYFWNGIGAASSNTLDLGDPLVIAEVKRLIQISGAYKEYFDTAVIVDLLGRALRKENTSSGQANIRAQAPKVFAFVASLGGDLKAGQVIVPPWLTAEMENWQAQEKAAAAMKAGKFFLDLRIGGVLLEVKELMKIAGPQSYSTRFNTLTIVNLLGLALRRADAARQTVIRTIVAPRVFSFVASLKGDINAGVVIEPAGIDQEMVNWQAAQTAPPMQPRPKTAEELQAEQLRQYNEALRKQQEADLVKRQQEAQAAAEYKRQRDAQTDREEAAQRAEAAAYEAELAAAAAAAAEAATPPRTTTSPTPVKFPYCVPRPGSCFDTDALRFQNAVNCEEGNYPKRTHGRCTRQQRFMSNTLEEYNPCDIAQFPTCALTSRENTARVAEEQRKAAEAAAKNPAESPVNISQPSSPVYPPSPPVYSYPPQAPQPRPETPSTFLPATIYNSTPPTIYSDQEDGTFLPATIYTAAATETEATKPSADSRSYSTLGIVAALVVGGGVVYMMTRKKKKGKR